ncbi:MAG: tRNA (adenosine(37)-N6)-dimethylallyltransferase MiaA [Acidimicrobiales bacterium]|nr:tRNA (adenosine(37)-N6)-dimethylallyltransferase MiaA [Acidimicrobiales bacterium]MXX43273.1 tRNA (adenosine(37)-N6)-dimethylallyltransferase MiaA [Acidimicrobiales bacterium]MYB80906.1 tRNA (adenosine(37)-N6)-dimethylallyltransferase MiaA [Acidimicrobiales bacterium]MYD34782.1 tRNA (adenosine(37)-N6)-dimethylallyltransferase MiaA [Acidimicrobiales bacterium]MYI08391.1 tRNA (adenosine(37)-N6)-dimethylallyltransferase MiaA [Acidimicrobiales bacterium]
MGGDGGHRPVVIVGPTASGKSALALELVRRARPRPDIAGPTELVSVDSMQVYRGMDIGTAKPAAAEQVDVPHHLIDLVDPAERFTVVDYATAFEAAMADIDRRGAVPLLVGGTGLYLRAVIDGLRPPPEFADIAAELEAEAAAISEPAAALDVGTVVLHQRLTELDPLAASRMEPTNLRRIVRALSVCLGTGRPFSSFGPGLQTYPEVPFRLVGIETDRDTLHDRIAERYRHQMAHGFLDEVRRLMDRQLSRTAAQALGYKELRAHVAGECSLEAALDLAIARTRRFARRQVRWFARDPRITWIPHRSVSAMADDVAQLET